MLIFLTLTSLSSSYDEEYDFVLQTISDVDKFCDSYEKYKLLHKHLYQNNKLNDMKLFMNLTIKTDFLMALLATHNLSGIQLLKMLLK